MFRLPANFLPKCPEYPDIYPVYINRKAYRARNHSHCFMPMPTIGTFDAHIPDNRCPVPEHRLPETGTRSWAIRPAVVNCSLKADYGMGSNKCLALYWCI